ncbi:MAG: type II toxin-antitoxin system RelE/ParE family toxin [Gammaproteobacteria bacterium]|nr:type II toxin-antitoxin system RelE/ParE family toxin [Gammaproteobacteria bacterium]
MNKISWTNKAKKDLRKIPQKQKVQIYSAIGALSQPLDEWHNVKLLVNNKYDYRLRVGNYRVVFDFEKKAKIISVEKIGVRNERTY